VSVLLQRKEIEGIRRTVDRDGGNGSSGGGGDLVLGEVGFGLIDELLGRVGATDPNGTSRVGPAEKRGGGHKGRTQTEE